MKATTQTTLTAGTSRRKLMQAGGAGEGGARMRRAADPGRG